MTVNSFERPDFYLIEKTHDGKLVVHFAEDIQEIEIDGEKAYQYEETVGTFPWSDSLAATIRRRPEAFLAKLKAQG